MRQSDLPVGTISFLFTDIEGSTRLLQETGPSFRQVLERHDELVRGAILTHGGVVVKNEGDGFFAAFRSAVGAVGAAVDLQRRLAVEDWGAPRPVKVRIGIHTGEAELGGADYVGIDVHRAARIGAAGHGGQIVISDVTARLVENGLPAGANLDDLGMHRLKDFDREERLHQVSVDGLESDFGPVRTMTTLKGNLPSITSTFIGRKRERDRVITALQSSRLVTVTGPAGVGKTALALHVASDVLTAYPDGVWVIEVSRLSDPGQIPNAIARQLHITESPGESLLDTLAARLSRAVTLIVLDGCEHLVADVASVADHLLQRTSALRILATSREWLSMRGERLVPLDPLPVPPESEIDPWNISVHDSVVLFEDRARLVQPDFVLDAATAPLVSEICRRLDGIPLAIELAAARLNVLSLGQLVDRLDRQFSFLASRSRDAPPHQQTLQTTLDWSYDFLAPAEQALFTRLSVFSGGFTIDAVESVCSDEDVPASQVLDLLGRLVETSLVTAGEGDPVRYRLLEPIAQYARLRLAESDQLTQLRERHALYFAELADHGEASLLGADQLTWLRALDRERYNLRSALNWFDEQERGADLLRMASALRWYWVIRREVSEGWHWLERGIGVNGEGDHEALARAHNGLALFSMMRLDFDRADLEFGLAHDLYEELGDRSNATRQAYHLAVLAWFRDDLDTAVRLGRESEESAREAGDRWTEGWSLAVQGTIARCLGDLVMAETLLHRSHRVFVSVGGMIDLGWSHLRLGALARDQGDYSLAVERYNSGKEMLLQAGDSLGAAHADAGIGAIAWLNGDEELALTLYRGVLEGFGLSEEASNNMFELKTMIQGNPSTANLLEVVEHNRQRASQYEGEVGPKAALAEYLYHMGKTAQRTGDDARAVRPLVESMRLAFEAVDWRAVAIAAAALAGLAADRGESTTAARLFGLAEAVAETDRLRDWPPPDEDGYLESMSWTERELDSQWSEEFDAGRKLTKAAAMSLVRGLGPVTAVR